MSVQDQLKTFIDQLEENNPEPTEPVDSVQLYINKCLEKVQNPTTKDRERLGVLHRAYMKWCYDQHIKPLPMKFFPGALRSKGYELKVGSGHRLYLAGFRLVPEIEVPTLVQGCPYTNH